MFKIDRFKCILFQFQDSIGYIGHSLGTTMMFQLLSTQTEYSRIIKPFIALAPVAYVGNIEALIMRIGALFEPILR
jgi:lysosomal acid lipase/cholesteryl ester hydrolase